MSNFEDVKVFMETFGQRVKTKPEIPNEKTMKLRFDLIQEELPFIKAEKIKHEIGSAYPSDTVSEISVKGRNLSEGVPRTFTLNSNEILDSLQEPLQAIANALKSALEQTPPELGYDIAERGIVLTGGGALLQNIEKLLAEETGLPVLIAENPYTSKKNINIAKMIKDNIEKGA